MKHEIENILSFVKGIEPENKYSMIVYEIEGDEISINMVFPMLDLTENYIFGRINGKHYYENSDLTAELLSIIIKASEVIEKRHENGNYNKTIKISEL